MILATLGEILYSRERISVVGAGLGLVLLCLVWAVPWGRKKAPLPPSPKGLPLIGHLHLIPPIRPWIWFDELGKKLNSPLVYLNLAGQDTVIINDYQIAIDLLEKRSASYSSRPRLVVASDYASMNKRMVLLPYGETWRQHRAAFQREVTPIKTLSYLPIQVAETKLLMAQVLHDPDNFMAHFLQSLANVILKVSYGLDSEHGNKEVMTEVYDVLQRLIASTNPGENLVDLFPSLDLLPDILAPWRAAAMEQQKTGRNMAQSFLNTVRGKVKRGELASDETFAGRLWDDREKLQLDELDVAFLAATVFEAGVDTTASALCTFILASISYPDAFLTAQAEVDRVCGGSLPTMDDFEKCEYIRALCKETLRWRVVTAGGLPHKATTTEDDFYAGFRIPAGATLIPNFWGMCFSEHTYGQKYDPQVYEPRRWIEREGGVGAIDDDHPAFGFGRRICPGRHLAIRSLFLGIANLCYYFDIKALEGHKVDTYAYTLGFNIHPEPFKCSITPRRGKQAEIEREAEAGRDALRAL